MSAPSVDSLELAMNEPCTAARCERFLRKFKTSLDSLRDRNGSHYESNSNADVDLIEAIESDTESDTSSLDSFDDVSLGVLITTPPSRQKDELNEAIESDTESDTSSLDAFDDGSLGVLISTSPSRQKDVLVPTSPSRPCGPTAEYGGKRVSLPISFHNSISLLHYAITLSFVYHMLAS